MNMIISAAKAKLFQTKPDIRKDDSSREMTILDHIDKIVEISNKYGIEKSFTKGKTHFDYVTAKLGISPLQALIFSQFLERSNENNIQISEIAKSLKCSIVKIIKYMNECEALEKKKLIRCSRGEHGTSYRISREVRESLQKKNDIIFEKTDNLSISKLFSVLKRIFNERRDDELNYETMKIELLDIINQNKHLIFCQKILSYNLRKRDLILLLLFCNLYGNNRDDNIMKHDINFLYDNDYESSEIEYELGQGGHILISNKLVDYANNGGFGNTDVWKLSDKAKNELLSELNHKRSFKKDLILFDSIKPKKMFYNMKQSEEVQKLISLLQNEKFCEIQSRLDNKGMRKGFACLFTGGPGTGKTETVYQIARETKRNIMMIDISETKSCWFGESEKKVKEIFDIYKTAVENSQITPILLFNEADAIIGKRNENTNRSIDQTENRMQNIILQEMENLSGILIATTNLVQNMDKAFERRFLYKINFEKPGMESRKGIWNAMMPELSESDSTELAKKFDVSGGQIENITRKIEVDTILNPGNISMDLLTLYCKNEINNSFNDSKVLGF